MKINQQQRDFIVDSIVHNINDAQVSEHYDFGDFTVTWVQAQQLYLIEHAQADIQNDWASPSDIPDVIDSLDNTVLYEWFCDEHCCDGEDFEEILQDEMETA